MNTHECPVAGCKARLPFDKAMCGAHWRSVPTPLRNEVYRLWARGRMREGYMQARQAAIDSVNARVGVRGT